MQKIRLGPDGIHMFDRDSGANVLLEEVIPPRDRWTSSPRQVSIALTNACDLECTHCYAPKKPARLSFESVKQWMIELDAAGCFGIGFGGGEPTLYPEIEELCHFGSTNTNLAITMTSHGHRLNEHTVDAFKSSVNFLRISMDGVHDTYEKIRGRSFPSLLEKLDLIKGHNILFGKVLFISPLVNYESETAKGLNIAFCEAVESYLSDCKELGIDPEKPCKGSLNVRLGHDLHLAASIAAFNESTSTNEFIKRAVQQQVS